MANRIQTKDDFVKVDLHIHTPASSCYKGPKTEDSYFQILHKAHAKRLSIIAITDHNSIEGYNQLLRIRERMNHEKRFLSTITDSEQATSQLKSLKSELEIFNSILMLPGVEFEVSNGIHLLVIFNDNTPVDHITRFLADGGYRPDNFGVEVPTIRSKWDIFRLFEESTKYDCIIIDAHTDSNKGILDTIPPGTTRADCFSSPQLSAVCYKNEEQKEKLKNTLATQKQYRRITPLAFLKSSDAHIAEGIGQPLSWVKVKKVSFDSLKSALSNPSEMISTEEPSMSRILDDLLKLPNSFGIPDLSTESMTHITKHICALANANGGYILLGVTPNKAKIGMAIDATSRQPYQAFVEPITKCCNGIEPILSRPPLTAYPLQNNKVILSLHVPKSPTLVNVEGDNRIYSIKNSSVYILKAIDVERLIQDKLLKDIDYKISRSLESVHNDCTLIKNTLSTLPIISLFDDNSVSARLNPSLSDSIHLDSNTIQNLKRRLHANGASRGNLFSAPNACPPRLPYAYLRYGLPLSTVRSMNRPSALKETIYITDGGATYYSQRDYPFFSEQLTQVIKLHGPLRLGGKFVTAFLKSSLNLWYLKNKLDDIDISKPEVFTQLRLPSLNLKRPDVIKILRDLHNDFDTILKLEAQLLAKINPLTNKDDINSCIEQHNSHVDQIAYKIDRHIYKLLNLSDEQISTIEENLRLNNIYLPESFSK